MPLLAAQLCMEWIPIKNLRVRFNDSWFVFHDSRWSFHEPYFSRKQISQIIQGDQNTRLWSLNLQTSTKLFDNIIILKMFLLTISFIILYFIKQRLGKHHLLQSRKQWNDKTRQLTIQAFIYYFIYSGVRNTFCKIMQHKWTWFVL